MGPFRGSRSTRRTWLQNLYQGQSIPTKGLELAPSSALYWGVTDKV